MNATNHYSTYEDEDIIIIFLLVLHLLRRISSPLRKRVSILYFLATSLTFLEDVRLSPGSA